MAGLEPLVVFWTGWGIHFMVLVSFTVQVTLQLLADTRRRKGWFLLTMVIWSAYMLADTTAIYALGHMSVVCRSPEHHLMALWAPLVLVHLGGQDNISAYAIEDNRLWLRHLLYFVLQVAGAGYVLYVSSILSHLSKLCSAAILMFVVGVLKYGERIWALKRANNCASSSLSATSYSKACRTTDEQQARANRFSEALRQMDLPCDWLDDALDCLYDVNSLLDVPKQMFEGPTSCVQISNVDAKVYEAEHMLDVVQLQLSMMNDLLYTKADVVHTWYGLFIRVISLLCTVAALLLFLHSSLDTYTRVDVTITNVLLSGAVALEIMSVLRAIFSRWTAILLVEKEWCILASLVFVVETFFTVITGLLFRSETYWSGRMGQHSLFKMRYHSDNRGSKMAQRIGMEDWWNSNVYSWSTRVPELVIPTVLRLVSMSTATQDITRSQGLNALRRGMNNEDRWVTWIWTEEELKLEERILVWHIATQVYMRWLGLYQNRGLGFEIEAATALAKYMFFLLAARPYMLPYPVSRQAYVQLCSDATTHLRYCSKGMLLKAILNQEEALLEGTPLQPDECIGLGRQGNDEQTGAAAQPQPSMNSTLDRGCQLAAKLIHITAKEKQESTTTAKGSRRKQRERKTQKRVDVKVMVNMVLEVWVEMLCYTAYLCNENSHARHLTDGGEIMTIITLLMIYTKNGLIRHRKNTSTNGDTAAGPSSQGATDIDSVV